mmetsp:Transcript_1379/g.4787  ORF Transcript_1379/g.4787 Transcript_1379/m.4787 type:complete len:182 (+) Transcript_1379:148-693(+)
MAPKQDASTNMPVVNSELFSLTYGSLVRQLLADYREDTAQVNSQLEKMGYNIGVRLIEEFLAKSGTQKCGSFRETAETIAKVGFKVFLGITANVANWNSDETECSLLLDDNPLADYVELPPHLQGLCYCNILCGVIRGALEMVSLKVEASFGKDALRGDDVFEIKLKLLEEVPEEYPFQDD